MTAVELTPVEAGGSVGFDVADGVATITLNRPRALNAMNREVQVQLRAAWLRVKTDHDIRVAIITGAGDRAFTSGADRGGMDDLPHTAEQRSGRKVVPGSPGAESDLEQHIAPKTIGCWKPVIAAINGIACGGAFYILGESDILIAADNATFFDPHVTFGMVSAYESIHMAQRMPFGEVLRMQLMGSYERLSAARAKEVGLVSEVVPLPDLLAAAHRVARAIAAQAPGAIQGTVRAIWATREQARSVALAMSPHFLVMADPDEWTAGQKTFSSGDRVEWTLR